MEQPLQGIGVWAWVLQQSADYMEVSEHEAHSRADGPHGARSSALFVS